jgi:membrane-bound lytic murein transglycosylase B
LRLCSIAVFCCVWFWGGSGVARSTPDPFAALKTRLVQDGFDSDGVEALYAKSEVTFDSGGVAAYFLHREGTANYDQFLTKHSIDAAFDYLEKHKKALKQAEEVYGVEGEVITAIILVETRFGTVIGKRLVINTLSTLAALGNKEDRDRFWKEHLRGKEGASKRRFDAWASQKSGWAYRELKAYLEYVDAQGLDPLSMPGSFAGALGISQFIPSSVLKFAQDGNLDGQVNLFDHEDAIMSIAYYLKVHGWKPGLSRSEQFRVVLTYNHSEYYAETILKVAGRLAEPM